MPTPQLSVFACLLAFTFDIVDRGPAAKCAVTAPPQFSLVTFAVSFLKSVSTRANLNVRGKLSPMPPALSTVASTRYLSRRDFTKTRCPGGPSKQHQHPMSFRCWSANSEWVSCKQLSLAFLRSYGNAKTH